jgi:acyl dehydratase
VSAQEITIDPELQRRIDEYLGRGTERPAKVARLAVNEASIQRFTDIVGDRNPVYADPQFAAASVHGSIVAPPTALAMWRLRGLEHTRLVTWTDHDGVTRFRQDPDGVRVRSDNARTIRDDLNDLMSEYGYVSPVVTNEKFEYRRYLRLGDRPIFHSPVIKAIVGPKQTKLGEGFFITLDSTVTDASGEVVAVGEQRYLRFRPATTDAPAKSSLRAARPIPAPPRASSVDSEPEPRLDTMAFGDVKVGDTLAPLVVELTPTLIIGGALATRDYQSVHLDRDHAIERGHPDVFMNIITSSGLVGRFVTDWAGPEALVQEFGIRLGRPNYPYDEMRLDGVVQEVRPAADGGQIVVDVSGTNSLGEHVRSSVVIALPAGGRWA